MPVVTGEFLFTQSCIATLAESLQLNLPPLLTPEPVAYADGEWRHVLEAAYGELAQIGLLDRGEPAGVLVDSLRVLCRGAVEFYGFITTGERQYYLHVAAAGQQRGQDAVFAALAGGEVLLRPARPDGLVWDLVAEFPEIRPAGGRSLSAAESDFERPQAEGQITNGPGPRGDARHLLTLFGKPRLGEGALGAAVRTGVDNRRGTSSDSISFFDLDDGRWLTYTTTDSTGRRHFTAAPGRTDTIATKLVEAQQTLLSQPR